MPIELEDNRHIISLEELRDDVKKKNFEEEKEEQVEKETKEGAKDPYLSDEDIKNYLERYRGRIPSVILRDIYEMLKGRRVTEKHIEKIVEKVEASLDTENQLRKIDDIYKKLESLEKALKEGNIPKVGRDEIKDEDSEVKSESESEKSEVSSEVEIEPKAVEEVKDAEVKSEVHTQAQAQVQAHSKETQAHPYNSHIKKEIPRYPARRDRFRERIREKERDKSRIREMLIRKARSEIERERREKLRVDREVDREYGSGGAGRMERLERLENLDLDDRAYYCSYYDYEPRLVEIPNDAKSIMLLLKWVEFLMERVGYEGLEDVLNYYVDINWISEDVLMAVLRYAKGIKLYHENSDWRPIGYMNVQDHLMSLLYIEALRTGRFDRNLIMEVEKDLYRMKKEVTELHGI